MKKTCQHVNNERNINSALLLGETGTGKTRLINSLVNYIFNVQFEDPFRLELKDHLVGGARKQIYSQTDYITAYLIYHRKGMPHDSNYMIIDTPGFNDTRGQHHQRESMERLRLFLMEDFGIDDLNCIGLVIKANENRELNAQREVLSNMKTLLGNDVAAITQLLATYASEDITVDVVARSAGIQFAHLNCFDNWPLYIPPKVRAKFSESQRENLKFRWQNMKHGCATFFETLIDMKPISLKKTRELVRERQILDGILMTLSQRVQETDNLIKTQKKRKSQQQQYEDEASKIEWKRNVPGTERRMYKVMKGYHVHNCDICDKTCILACEDPTKIKQTFLGTVAGAGGTGAAAGFVAGPPGAAVGAVIGGGVVGTGTYIYYSMKSGECSYSKRSTICGEKGCMDELSEHSVGIKRIVKEEVVDEVIDYKAKTGFDKIMTKINDLREKIDLDKVYLYDAIETFRSDIKSLVLCVKKIENLSLDTQSLDPYTLIDKLILEAKDVSHVENYHALRNTAKIMIRSILSGNDCDRSVEGYHDVLFNV